MCFRKTTFTWTYLDKGKYNGTHLERKRIKQQLVYPFLKEKNSETNFYFYVINNAHYFCIASTLNRVSVNSRDAIKDILMFYNFIL